MGGRKQAMGSWGGTLPQLYTHTCRHTQAVHMWNAMGKVNLQYMKGCDFCFQMHDHPSCLSAVHFPTPSYPFYADP